MAVINAFSQDAVDRAEPLTVAAAYAQCRDAALAESAIGAIGLEIESHLVDLDHVADPVPWERVEAIAAAVGRVAPSTAVTVEPGGQIELSGPPDAGVGPAVARLRYESTGARLALAECRLGLAHAGADPARPSLRVNRACAPAVSWQLRRTRHNQDQPYSGLHTFRGIPHRLRCRLRRRALRLQERVGYPVAESQQAGSGQCCRQGAAPPDGVG